MLFEVTHLSIGYKKKKEEVVLVDDLSFSLDCGQVMALVGQSGSGKTITADALCGLLKPPLRQLAGRIFFNGKALWEKKGKEGEDIRGRGIFYLFQHPLAALNPTLSVGKQIQEALIRHLKMSKATSQKKAKNLLEEVGIGADRFHLFPFALSGGMRQRVLLAMALGLRPKLLIADEPFTALDPVRQEEILVLLEKLREKGTAVLVISHDLSLVTTWVDQVALMVQGRIVEQWVGKGLDIQGRHPYLQSLLKNRLLLEEALGGPA